jgi:hypothetical protein
MSENHHTNPVRHAAYLGVTTGLVPSKSLPRGQSMVILTFRPAPSHSWRPQSFGLTLDEAARLKKDIASILKRCGLALLLSLTVAGCSGRLEVRHERPSAAPTNGPPSSDAKASGSESSAAEVEVGLLQERSPHARPMPKPSPAPAAKPEPVPQVVVVNIVGNELHVHEPVPERRRETVRLRVKVEQEPVVDDPECLRAMRAHQERVRRWEQEFRRR